MTAELRNAASDRARSILSEWVDWETLVTRWESWYADDFVRDDRRRLINMPLADRAVYLEHSRVWFEIADGKPEFLVREVVAVRGDRLVAWIVEAAYQNAPSVVAVVVSQFDEAIGCIQKQVHFDLEDVDAALAALDSMYAALDG